MAIDKNLFISILHDFAPDAEYLRHSYAEPFDDGEPAYTIIYKRNDSIHRISFSLEEILEFMWKKMLDLNSY